MTEKGKKKPKKTTEYKVKTENLLYVDAFWDFWMLIHFASYDITKTENL